MRHRKASQTAGMLLALVLMLGAGLLRSHGWRRDNHHGTPTSPPHHSIVNGRAVAIADGDSLEISTADRRRVGVRLLGIDAPESGQAFGGQAREALRREIQGRPIVIRVVETDQYGRLVGDLYHDGTWINEAMVAQGWAWHYARYSDHPDLARAERAARAERRGLWRDPRPTPPWIWRRQHPRDNTR